MTTQGLALKVSTAAIAVSLFLTINIAIPASSFLKKDKEAGDTIQRALAGAVQTLDQARPKNTVALIGSSLVIAPLWSTDVSRGYFHQDCMNHHTSTQLTKKLAADGIDADVVSLATAGQFVSDTYLIVDKYLKAEKKPEILIYGIAPRDFMDDTAGGLALTSVFDQIVGVEDIGQISQLFFSTYEERIDFILNRSAYLYRKRGRYQTKFQDNCRKLASKIMGDRTDKIVVSGQNDPLAGFLLGGNRNEIWAKSIEEYSRRYRYFNAQQFDKQKECFKALVALCKERDIKLCVLAMPLTQDNRRLMPPQFYDRYISFVEHATHAADIPFVDLEKGSCSYKDEDFYDTVHLNSAGGERFLTTVSEIVADKNPSLARSKPSSPTY
jgi:hypothetical protein